MIKKPFLFFLFVLSTLACFAQSVYFQDHKLPFYNTDGTRFKNALSGGLSLPQLSQADLNGDKLPELIAFDRTDSQFVVFRNLGLDTTDTWRYDPSLDSAFAECDCANWALMADYSDDGLPDLFCGSNSGFVKVFELSLSPKPDGGYFPVLTETYHPLGIYLSPGGIFNYMTIQSTDVPALTDVDYDGDLDILAFQDFYNTVYFYRNMAYEELSQTNVIYNLTIEKECYGNFYEVSNGSAVVLKVDQFAIGCTYHGKTAAPQHGGGSTILAVDIDNDYDKDLIIGDIGTERAYVLRSSGTIDSVTMDTVWTHFPPQGTPFQATTFPAMFSIDADNDKHRDILIAPCDAKDYRNQHALNLYRDTSSTATPSYAFHPHDFLQQSTLDLGGFSVPAFADINGDSLQDLLVGTRGFRETNSAAWSRGTLVLFTNTGTAANPVFTLTDSNYLHVADTVPARQDLSPAFGDIDADGDLDLLVGLVNGKIMLYRNNASHGTTSAQFDLETDTLGGIDVGDYAAPALFDVDGDSTLDLVVGNGRGWLYYFHNDSTPQTPVWTLVSNKWGSVKSNAKPGNLLSNGFSKPVFADVDRDGIQDLIVGEEIGVVKVYTIGAQPTDTFLVKDIAFFYDFGKHSAPAFAVLDSTGDLSMLVGNARGGLQLFRTLALPEADTTVVPNAIGEVNHPTWEMYPNPTTAAVRLTFLSGAARTLEIADVTGRVLVRLHTTEASPMLEVHDLPAGLYLVRVMEGNHTSARRLIINN